jgi:hypothetical protein
MWSTNTYSNRWFTTHTPSCIGQPVLFTPHLTPSWSSARSRKAQGSSVVLDTPKVEERAWAQGPRLAQEQIDCGPAGASPRRLRTLPTCPPNTVARRAPRSRAHRLLHGAVQCHRHPGSLLLREHVRTYACCHRIHTMLLRWVSTHSGYAQHGICPAPLHARAIPVPRLKEETVIAQSVDLEGQSVT